MRPVVRTGVYAYGRSTNPNTAGGRREVSAIPMAASLLYNHRPSGLSSYNAASVAHHHEPPVSTPFRQGVRSRPRLGRRRSARSGSPHPPASGRASASVPAPPSDRPLARRAVGKARRAERVPTLRAPVHRLDAASHRHRALSPLPCVSLVTVAIDQRDARPPTPFHGATVPHSCDAGRTTLSRRRASVVRVPSSGGISCPLRHGSCDARLSSTA